MSELTPEELKPGRELDQRVAEAMGWQDFVKSRFDDDLLGLMPGDKRPRSGNTSRHSIVPRYSTDIAAAWPLVTELEMTVYAPRAWYAGGEYQNGEDWMAECGRYVRAFGGESGPHAICMALLKAKVRGG